MFLTNIEISTITDGLRLIKAQIMSSYNARSIPQFGPAGLDSAPIAKQLAVTTPTATRGADVVLGYQNQNQIAEPGETILYSCDADGVYKATAAMRVDGTMELLGTGDFLVRYTALDTSLQAQTALINANLTLVATAIATLAAELGLPPTPPLYTPTSVTINTTPAKITKIKTTSS